MAIIYKNHKKISLYTSIGYQAKTSGAYIKTMVKPVKINITINNIINCKASTTGLWRHSFGIPEIGLPPIFGPHLTAPISSRKVS